MGERDKLTGRNAIMDKDRHKNGEGTPGAGAGIDKKPRPTAIKSESKENTPGGPRKSPKKRRKVNHACVYCRRSHMTCDLERPCTRCIKRNIGHLCHDEPREGDKKPKSSDDPPRVGGSNESADVSSDATPTPISTTMGPPMNLDNRQSGTPSSFRPRSGAGSTASGAGGQGLMQQGNPLALVSPSPGQGIQSNALNNSGSNGNANQFAGFSDAWMTAQNFQDMNSYNPNFMIAPEVSHEFNILNDFLQTSMLDDNGVPIDDSQQTGSGYVGANLQEMLPDFNGGGGAPPGSRNATSGPGPRFPGSAGSMPPPPTADARSIARPGSTAPGDKDKTREYYLQAADPSGNDTPDERMSRVLKAKYEAGLLKPFNYINGYTRLMNYLDGHIAQGSKQKILRSISQFRPKFREKAQDLSDMALVYVEMWFEKQLMDYDRVFASMAVPACCWRRTGEIFRGNKEMAELISVPVDRLRDGKIALHEILTEESMVRYWEEFGTIAFDPAHETLLTACELKSPSDTSKHRVKCCFSFTIRRDEHKLPALIVGNFLPHDPPPQAP